MSKTVVVFTCAHATPEVPNDRATLLGKLLLDLRPDYVVDLGDGADMKSLNTFDDRNPQALVVQSYEADIDCYNDFQERIRHPFKKAKRKRPTFYGIEGNHEYRIRKAISHDPRLEGKEKGISFGHLNTNQWFSEYREYKHKAPDILTLDGVDYSHYIGSGNFGRAMSGEHHAYGLLKKRMNSVTVGHSHKRNVYFRDDARKIGLVAGCFKGAHEAWAGQANHEWWSGVVIKRSLEDGYYEPQFVSLKDLEKEYA